MVVVLAGGPARILLLVDGAAGLARWAAGDAHRGGVPYRALLRELGQRHVQLVLQTGIPNRTGHLEAPPDAAAGTATSKSPACLSTISHAFLTHFSAPPTSNPYAILHGLLSGHADWLLIGC